MRNQDVPSGLTTQLLRQHYHRGGLKHCVVGVQCALLSPQPVERGEMVVLTPRKKVPTKRVSWSLIGLKLKNKRAQEPLLNRGLVQARLQAGTLPGRMHRCLLWEPALVKELLESFVNQQDGGTFCNPIAAAQP